VPYWKAALNSLLSRLLNSHLAEHPAHALADLVQHAALTAITATTTGDAPSVASSGKDRSLLTRALLAAAKGEHLLTIAKQLSPAQTLRCVGLALGRGDFSSAKVLLKHITQQHGLRRVDLAPHFIELLNGMAASDMVVREVQLACTAEVEHAGQPAAQRKAPFVGGLRGCEEYIVGMIKWLSRDPEVDLAKGLTAPAKRLAIAMAVTERAPVTAVRLWSTWCAAHNPHDLGRVALLNVLLAVAEVRDWATGAAVLRAVYQVAGLSHLADIGRRGIAAYLRVLCGVTLQASVPQPNARGKSLLQAPKESGWPELTVRSFAPAGLKPKPLRTRTLVASEEAAPPAAPSAAAATGDAASGSEAVSEAAAATAATAAASKPAVVPKDELEVLGEQMLALIARPRFIGPHQAALLELLQQTTTQLCVLAGVAAPAGSRRPGRRPNTPPISPRKLAHAVMLAVMLTQQMRRQDSVWRENEAKQLSGIYMALCAAIQALDRRVVAGEGMSGQEQAAAAPAAATSTSTPGLVRPDPPPPGGRRGRPPGSGKASGTTVKGARASKAVVVQ